MPPSNKIWSLNSHSIEPKRMNCKLIQRWWLFPKTEYYLSQQGTRTGSATNGNTNSRLTHEARKLEIRDGWATQAYEGETLNRSLHSIFWIGWSLGSFWITGIIKAVTCTFWKMMKELNSENKQFQKMYNNEGLTVYPYSHLERLKWNAIFYSLTQIETIVHWNYNLTPEEREAAIRGKQFCNAAKNIRWSYSFSYHENCWS